MSEATPTPSIANLRHFARKRARGVTPSVRSDKASASKPPGERFAAFYYEKLITALIAFSRSGFTGRAVEDAVAAAPSLKQPSFADAGTGIKRFLAETRPSKVSRKQRSLRACDTDGTELVTIRPHLVLEDEAGQTIWVHVYFGEGKLAPIERDLIETALALATADQTLLPLIAVLRARSGELAIIDRATASSATRVDQLRTESDAYRAAWADVDLDDAPGERN